LERKILWGNGRFNKWSFDISSKAAKIWRQEHYLNLIRKIYELMANACRHPRVRVVSRHEDTEFVECLECGEVFDSEEFRDMEIEDSAETEDVSDDS
jgi:hypothetical protein